LSSSQNSLYFVKKTESKLPAILNDLLDHRERFAATLRL